MKRLAVAFSGPSNSGKTTLIEKISKQLNNKLKIAIIKHDPKDKAKFDTDGKDSKRFFDSGAETIVVSPTKTTYFSHNSRNLDKLIELFGQFDLLMVEGLKSWDLPRISVFREEIDESYLDVSDAIAIDKSVDIDRYNIPSNIMILDLNSVDEIIEWILKYAKRV